MKHDKCFYYEEAFLLNVSNSVTSKPPSFFIKWLYMYVWEHTGFQDLENFCAFTPTKTNKKLRLIHQQYFFDCCFFFF